jgi:gentisate 1,2-dioxygenase
MSELRAVGDRVLVRRVQPGGQLITHVYETMGITDRVLQFGEVVGLGSEWTTGKYRHLELQPKDLVIYPTPRVHDHFRHHFGNGPGGGWQDVLVLPGYWICGILRDHFLSEHPEAREYGDTLK